LPPEIKLAARKQYRLWKDNSRHPSRNSKKSGHSGLQESRKITARSRCCGMIRTIGSGLALTLNMKKF
jgi:hypothetical protein